MFFYTGNVLAHNDFVLWLCHTNLPWQPWMTWPRQVIVL